MKMIPSILLLMFSLPGWAQPSDNIESELLLKNKRYNGHQFKVLHQSYDDTAQNLLPVRKINVTRDGNLIASMRLPIADLEAKNFSVNKIAETPQGFLMAVDWGGGNYFYNNTYYFVYQDGQFYLRDIDWSLYIHEAQKNESYHRKLKPPVSLSEVDMSKYLWKE